MYPSTDEKKRTERHPHHVFGPDNFGGYQPELKSFYIDELEIIKTISKPLRKKLGRSRTTFLFPDLLD